MAVLAGIGALLVFGQVLQLHSFPPMTIAERVWVIFSILCYSAAVTGSVAIVGGLATRRRIGLLAALFWAVSLAASTIYLLDHFSYSWLSLHLNETIPLLVQNVRTDFQVMASKRLALVAALGSYLAALVVGTLAIRHCMIRKAWCAKPVSLRAAVTALGLSLLLLLAERVGAPRALSARTYQAKNDVLWQVKLYAPRHPSQQKPILDLESPTFRQVRDERDIEAALALLSPRDVAHPYNIFLFVVESLREDAITEETTPNLVRFKQQSLPVHAGLAAANLTHMSWYSLLHGLNPIYWSVEAHQSHSAGAVPIRALRKVGYRIAAIASPSLEYYGFSKSVFGDNEALATTLADQRAFFDPAIDRSTGDIDEKVMRRLGQELDAVGPDSRAFYLTMLDAPHHDYNWSARYHPKFLPFSEQVSLLTTAPSEITPLRNRYKNAVNFTDMLLGEFLQKLAALGLMEHSIVAITGDHGEEFLERGHLTHSSELNRFQTRVPILIYLPPSAPAGGPSSTRASHLDIFPTIFDVLGLKRQTEGFLDGTSVRGGAPDRILFCAMASSYTPAEVLLDGGEYKVLVELEGSGKVGRTVYARRLYVSKVLNQQDEEVTLDGREGRPTPTQILDRFSPGLHQILVEP